MAEATGSANQVSTAAQVQATIYSLLKVKKCL